MGFVVSVSGKTLKTGILILAVFYSFYSRAQTSTLKANIPKSISGYTLNEIVSCSFLDKIPWKFKNNDKTTKILIKDRLTLSGEMDAAIWEIHQIMDNNGEVRFAFRRPVGNGEWEKFEIRELEMIHTVGTAAGAYRSKNIKKLKSLIDRPVLTFTDSKGNSVSALPGSSGVTTLNIQLSQGEGRLLPPLFVKGSTCERPSDETNSSTGPAAKPSSPASSSNSATKTGA